MASRGRAGRTARSRSWLPPSNPRTEPGVGYTSLVDTTSPLFLALDLTGVFAFALNGGMTAIRVARLDLVGVLTLSMITALGGGIVRDVFIDALPPATFSDWRYLSVAAAGGLVAFVAGPRLDHRLNPITVLDAAGLSLL